MQKNRRISKVVVFFSVSLLAALTLWSCSHGTSTPPSTVDLTWKTPGVGSLYVETHFHGALGVGSEGNSDANLTVTSNGTFEGKANVVTLSTGKEYIVLESNGDYSVLDSAFGYGQADWQRFPTGSDSTVKQSTDTVVYLVDSLQVHDTIHVHKAYTRTYIGVQNIPDAHAKAYDTYKIHEVCIEDDSLLRFNINSNPVYTTFNTDYWIAPTIGWILKDSTCDGTNWNTKILDGCTVY